MNPAVWEVKRKVGSLLKVSVVTPVLFSSLNDTSEIEISANTQESMTDLTRNVASNAAEIQVSAMDLTKTGGSKATEAEIPALDLTKRSQVTNGQQSSESEEPPQLEVRVGPDSSVNEIPQPDQEKVRQSKTRPELEIDPEIQNLLVKRLPNVREGVPPGMVIDRVIKVTFSAHKFRFQMNCHLANQT